QIQKVIETLVEVGYDVHRSTGVNHTVLGAVGVPREPIDPRAIELIPGVGQVIKISEPYKLVGRTFKAADTIVDVAGGKVGGGEGRRWGAGPGRARWRPTTRRPRSRAPSRPRGRACCGAAPSSRGPRPTPSRATARKRSAGCGRPPTRPASP